MIPNYSSFVEPIFFDPSVSEKAISIEELPQSKFLFITLDKSGL